MPSIKRILVANRGEIVSRVARTARARGIQTIGLYTESDVTAPYLADVDYAVSLGDDGATSPYLDSEAMVAAAVAAGADAVHPGYGFLAESAGFARAVIGAGLVWIGPPPAAIEAMGGKIRAKQIAEKAGLPVLKSVTVSSDVAASVELIRAELPPPLLVKPSAGGGGKGMHRVDDLGQLAGTLVTAQREAQAAFGDGTLFVERLLEGARHVEVQIIADQHGTVTHLGTRDCSVQRRHQKIVEEAPAPELPAGVQEVLCDSAVRLAAEIGYTGAGTAEFLVLGAECAFLEMNTRLQVEHLVTEAVTGLDLVALQIEVAQGQRLPFGPAGVGAHGHSIEVRLYAEDPAAGYLPSPGPVALLDALAVDGVRWELGAASGSVVSSRYDPMIAKVVAAGADRDQARQRLVTALTGLRIGPIRTNRGQLIAILLDPDFAAAALATNFLDDRPQLQQDTADPRQAAWAAALTTVYLVAANRERAAVQRFTPPAWRNLRSQDSLKDLVIDGTRYDVRYRPTGPGRWLVDVGGAPRQVRVFAAGPQADAEIDAEIDGVRGRTTVAAAGDTFLVCGPFGQSVVRETEILGTAGSAADAALVAPLPGVVVELAVTVGDTVEAGDTIAVIEAMKMEHRIRAPEAGTVAAVHVELGQPVANQQRLVEIDAVAAAPA